MNTELIQEVLNESKILDLINMQICQMKNNFNLDANTVFMGLDVYNVLRCSSWCRVPPKPNQWQPYIGVVFGLNIILVHSHGELIHVAAVQNERT